ncbi:hypothetical protein FNV43_RR24361 [Rhamnella rubrinervis]|uniref:Uncharacterized protein n=1 Tax=Rhamnella rubrinervis TaxID=2594499 RepID=A0A8K0DS41_9ROSA|nr:hypothetical protein FNV43_RR24361 [Rhamnella rubrinervis]
MKCQRNGEVEKGVGFVDQVERNMAGEAGLFKFLNPRRRPQSTDIQAAGMWGVAATTTALWIVQPFDWLRKTFFEKPEAENFACSSSNSVPCHNPITYA